MAAADMQPGKLRTLLLELFGPNLEFEYARGLLTGGGTLKTGTTVDLLGVTDGIAPGVDELVALSRHVLAVISRAQETPLLLLLDCDSQRMSRRDELLGLNEYLAHLAKCLIWADLHGRPTYALLYGHAAAGAFIATALAARDLLATPEALPEVMNLASMARVTKLPLSLLAAKAQTTPVFAPGVNNLERMGAVHAIAEAPALAARLQELMQESALRGDTRDELGLQRGGRPKAASIAAQVRDLVLQ